jgi:hypothetical protein
LRFIPAEIGSLAMKILQSALVGLLASAGAGSAAYAYDLSPTQTKFTLTGPAAIAIGGQFKSCTITMTGKIPRKSKNALIETMSDNGTCGVAALNLPWPVRAKNATSATITNFAYSIPGNVCGGSSAHPTINSSGVWTLSKKVEGSTGVCVFGATLSSQPPITIVP